MRTIFYSICALPFFLSGASIAAEPTVTRLEFISGKVLVNQGKGFVTANSNTLLQPGTEIFVGDDSTATLSFAQNHQQKPCSVVLKPASVTTVSDSGMCEEVNEAAIDSFETTKITPVAGDPPPSQIPPPVAAGVFVTSVAALAIFGLVQGDKKDTPISTD
jgi:hypothetical protein